MTNCADEAFFFHPAIKGREINSLAKAKG